MGYTLKIGQARMDYCEERVDIDCDIIRLDDAPAFGETTDHENQRWPSYTVWADFVRRLDIMPVMCQDRNAEEWGFEWRGNHYGPLIVSHPGAAPITAAHAEYVRAKLDFYKAQHPDHIPMYPPPKEGAKPLCGDLYRDEDLVDDPKYDPVLVRGEWLVWWLEWAVKNCTMPVFVNS